MVRRCKDTVMVKRAVPKVVVLPNGRRFTGRYKKGTRVPQHANVTLIGHTNKEPPLKIDDDVKEVRK